MIARWNERVADSDIVYHLGDLMMGEGVDQKDLDAIMPRLKGKKRLVLGNHDGMQMSAYARYFQKIMSWRHFGTDLTGCEVSFIACHYPLHPSTVNDGELIGNQFCLHGHTHDRLIADLSYINVCVEHTGFAPVALEDLVATMQSRRTVLREAA